MSLLIAESFDYWNTGITSRMKPAGGWTWHPSYESVRGGYSDYRYGRHGSYGYIVNGHYLYRYLDAAEKHSTLIFGTGVAGNSGDLCSFGSGALGTIAGMLANITVAIVAGPRVNVYAGKGPMLGASWATLGGPNGSLLASSAIVDLGYVGTPSQWRYLEVKVSPSGVIVMLEDQQIINVGGGSGGVMDNFVVWGPNPIDDVYLLNGKSPGANTFITTAAKVVAVRPTADHVAEWTPSYGANWDTQDSQNSYGDPMGNRTVISDITGNTDLYEVGDITLGTEETIKGVVLTAHARKLDAGARSLALLCKVGGTTAQSADLPLVHYTSASPYVEPLDKVYCLDRQPNGSAWDEAAFDSAKFGFVARP